MGNQLRCTLRQEGQSFSGKALLETSEIYFRGDIRLKIPFNAITNVHATGGELHVSTKDRLAIFELGSKAAAEWHQKITNPKSVLEKLGVNSGQSVSLFGTFTPAFLSDLKKKGAKIIDNKLAKGSAWIFFLANEKQELAKLSPLAKQIRGATALWLVYPKGQKSITESDVRSAGLKSGLVDVKVVSFSPTLTALKFVLRKSSR